MADIKRDPERENEPERRTAGSHESDDEIGRKLLGGHGSDTGEAFLAGIQKPEEEEKKSSGRW